ncbi:MAG: NUDIX hydrolase [Pseudomonadota bacterium]
MHRNDLLDQLRRHRTRHLDEAAFVTRAVRFVANHPDTFYRDHWPAHVTGSAWVLNPARTAALLLHHKKHDRWFQPGGHADGDPDVRGVALRETSEETGLDPARIRLLDEAIFDVDIHTLPDRPGCPRHGHIDIRYLVEIDDHLPIPGNDESHELRWVPLWAITRFNNSRSTRRMVEKSRHLVRASRPG